jgi:hypothetical protein
MTSRSAAIGRPVKTGEPPPNAWDMAHVRPVHPVADGQVVDAHGSVVDQTPFGIRFRFPIPSCGLPVRQNLACFGLIDRCTSEVSSLLDFFLYACRHRLANGYGHTTQKTGAILDLGFLKRIDTFCFGGWLTALVVNTGQMWQANQAGERRSRPGIRPAGD